MVALDNRLLIAYLVPMPRQDQMTRETQVCPHGFYFGTTCVACKLEQAKEALRALYDLKEGMEKPQEHKPTREALRKTELVLFGYSNL